MGAFSLIVVINLLNRSCFLLILWDTICGHSWSKMSGLSRPEDHRRKWDKDEFEQLARLRAQLANEESGGSKLASDGKAAPKRALLEYRDYKVDLDSKLGKTQ